MYNEVINILTGAKTDPDYSMTRECTSHEHFRYTLTDKLGNKVIEALIKEQTSGFCNYDELRMLTYKGTTYQYGYISASIDPDTHDNLVDLFKNFNSDRALLLAENAQQDFENALKEFEHLVIEAKKEGTLHVDQEIDGIIKRKVQCYGYSRWTVVTYIVKINGDYVGLCTEEKSISWSEVGMYNEGKPRFFARLMKFGGKSYKEEDFNFNCFWYSMLITQMHQWKK